MKYRAKINFIPITEIFPDNVDNYICLSPSLTLKKKIVFTIAALINSTDLEDMISINSIE